MAVSAKLGVPFMPHQEHAAMIFGEFDPETGIPYYREMIVTWPRQTGKTIFVTAVEGERCIIWEDPQRVLYTAQTGSDARDKLLLDQAPMFEKRMPKYVKRIYRAKGEEAVAFRNGSRIDLAATTKGSGHGATIDLGVLDECWADEDNRREQTILPMIKTRPKAQILVCSTQGTQESVFLNRKVEVGRAAAAADVGHGIAYLEYSVPEDADIENPEVWWQYMPGLGYTISEEAIAHDLMSMDEAEFRRADCNQCVKDSGERIIPEITWQAVCKSTAEVNRAEQVTIAVDVSPDRTKAAIVASDGATVELIDYRDGTGWVVERALELWGKWPCSFLIDAGGPGASLVPELEAAGLDVTKWNTTEVVAACGAMYDAIADGTVTFRTHELFDRAVAGLARRPISDRFLWSRSTSTADISPFMAGTLAYGKAHLTPDVQFYAFS